jgi:hypothetical protein
MHRVGFGFVRSFVSFRERETSCSVHSVMDSVKPGRRDGHLVRHHLGRWFEDRGSTRLDQLDYQTCLADDSMRFFDLMLRAPLAMGLIGGLLRRDLSFNHHRRWVISLGFITSVSTTSVGFQRSLRFISVSYAGVTC